MKPNLNKNLKIQHNPLYELLNIEKNLHPEILKDFHDLIETGLASSNLSKFLGDRCNYNLESFLASQIFRDEYILNYGFALLNNDFINDLSDLLKNKKCIDVGAGSGFLSSLLQQKNIDITAIDLQINNNNYGFKKIYTDIIEMEASQYLELHRDYSHIILSWPNLGSNFAYNVLNELPKGKSLIYMGEHEGGCCANDNFFKLLKEKATLNDSATRLLNSSFFSWTTIRDRCFIYDIK